MKCLQPAKAGPNRLDHFDSETARAGISEYWIVDPQKRRILVLVLRDKTYRQHGSFGPGSRAASALLEGFSVSVDDVFAAAEKKS